MEQMLLLSVNKSLSFATGTKHLNIYYCYFIYSYKTSNRKAWQFIYTFSEGGRISQIFHPLLVTIFIITPTNKRLV